MRPHEVMGLAYRRFIADSPPIVVPTNIVHLKDHVRASGLGGCATEHAYSKLPVPPVTNPEATPEQDEDKHWLFSQGSHTAESLQKALMYHAQIHTNVAFRPEVSLRDDDLKLAGRADGILTIEELDVLDSWIIEFKDTEGQIKRSVGEPKANYMLQMLAYMMMANIPQGMLVLMSHWKRSVWYLKPKWYSELDRGFVLTDVYGNPYTPKYGENWNTPAFLNYSTVRAEVERLHDYMTLAQNWLHEPTLPAPPPQITDPLNDAEGWRCVWTADKGKKTDRGSGPARPPAVEPNCPFFSLCHGHHPKNSDGLIELVRGDGDSLHFPQET